MHRGTRTYQSAVSAHQYYQATSNVYSKQWHDNRSQNAPYDQRMPLPLPDIADQTHRMMAQVFKLFSIHRKLARMEEMYA